MKIRDKIAENTPSIPENKVQNVKQFILYLGLVSIAVGVLSTTITDLYFSLPGKITGYIATALTSSIMVAMILKYKLLELHLPIETVVKKPELKTEGEPVNLSKLINIQDRLDNIQQLDSKAETNEEIERLLSSSGIEQEKLVECKQLIEKYDFKLIDVLKYSNDKDQLLCLVQ